jgi:FkbM family methyltransferase
VDARGRVAAAWSTLRFSELPVGARLRFLASGLRPTDGAAHAISVGGGEVVVTARGGDRSDRAVIREIFERSYYRADYYGAVVLDMGAHKGYYGAYALWHGAAVVESYEPVETNFAYLDRAAESFRRSGFRWDVHHLAVTSTGNPVEIVTSPKSWTHAVRDAGADAAARGVAVVNAVAFADVIARVREEHPDDVLIVKLDVEGTECEIVARTPSEVWTSIDEVFVETHEEAPCDASAVADRLRAAGFQVALRGEDVLHGTRDESRRR